MAEKITEGDIVKLSTELSTEESDSSEDSECGDIYITQYTKDRPKPSQIDHVHWIWYTTLIEVPRVKGLTLGKWLIFRHFDEIDEVWEKIVNAMIDKELGACYHAKCSTMRYDPSLSGPGPDKSAVICVYTREDDMIDIGFKLIQIVEHDIKYKTDAATLNYEYTHAGSGKVTIKTIFWNNGNPSFECEDQPCYSTSYTREDIWRVNIVDGPEPMCSEEDYGRWILSLEYLELTSLWHDLKPMIESKDKDFGAIRMECPAKRDRKSPTEKPVFLIYTNKEKKDSVGMKLIKIVETDIFYEHKSVNSSSRCTPFDNLYWNDGEPDYDRVRRKGITRNWRTGK